MKGCKTTIGILSIPLSVIVLIRSLMVIGWYNSSSAAGSGMLFSFCCLIIGIVLIATRNRGKASAIFACIGYFVIFICTIANYGQYSLLPFWGIIVFIYSLILLAFSLTAGRSVKKKSAYIPGAAFDPKGIFSQENTNLRLSDCHTAEETKFVLNGTCYDRKRYVRKTADALKGAYNYPLLKALAADLQKNSVLNIDQANFSAANLAAKETEPAESAVKDQGLS